MIFIGEQIPLKISVHLLFHSSLSFNLPECKTDKNELQLKFGQAGWTLRPIAKDILNAVFKKKTQKQKQKT